MPLGWLGKLFIVIAVLVGLYYGSSVKDRDRWKAALHVSNTSATKLRIESEYSRFRDEVAQKEARRRGVSKSEDVHAAAGTSKLTAEDLCSHWRDYEAQLVAKGTPLDARQQQMKAMCAGSEHIEHTD